MGAWLDEDRPLIDEHRIRTEQALHPAVANLPITLPGFIPVNFRVDA
jgi:hypothetical protein